MKNNKNLIMTLFIINSCDSGSPQKGEDDPQARSFYMGYTTWPFVPGDDRAQDFVYDRVKTSWYSDIGALHFMDGIPWSVNNSNYVDPSEAGVTSQYTAQVNPDLGNARVILLDRIIATAPQEVIYLAIDPLNDTRGYRAREFATAVEPEDQDFHDDAVHYAYSNYAVYALWLIYEYYTENEYTLPKIYFNFGSEASDLGLASLTAWDNFEVFAQGFSSQIRGYSHSDGAFQSFVRSTDLLFSVVLRSPGSSTMTQLQEAIADSDGTMANEQITDYIDLIGISSYGYLFYDDMWGGEDVGPSTLGNDRLYQDDRRGNPSNLPSDWLSQIQTIAPGIPYGITETGWIGEDLMRPSMMDFDEANGANGFDDYLITATEDYQNRYVQMTLEEAQQMAFQFVIFFTLVDYDIGHDVMEQYVYVVLSGQDKQDALNLYDCWIKTGFFQPNENMDSWDEYDIFPGDLMERLEQRPSWTTWGNWFAKDLNP
ncbi:MAG: hypothetical protein PF447_13170 [Spirochaetaceae bacterium]|nr:hypothetical protein [Spirochaetaceae bacterium]